MAKPILKWAGGKTKALPSILPLLRERVDRGDLYSEPFFGGGSVGLALEPQRWVFADACAPLRATYREVRASPNALLELLTQEEQTESRYYDLRAQFNSGLLTRRGTAVAMIYLNKLGFNGLYRENRKGLMNVPWGKRTVEWDTDGIRSAATVLGRAAAQENWRRCLFWSPDVIYADPPYDPVKKTSFVGYGATRFGWDDQVALADALAAAAQRGATVVASNAATERVRALYAERGFTIGTVQMRRNINRNGKGRGAVDELLMHRNACELPKAAE